ncbi:MAG: glycoside hydrolase family 15 protein [Elusimicrobia bacterium]|nr:glycoside hydrolase family 15 protein [Elusimicrobiota bacterium]
MTRTKGLDHAFIGNCTSGALVGPDGSIDWLCLPFFDSASVFARLLDEGKGGYFRIAGADVLRVSQEYLFHTPILKTTVETRDGTFEVRDLMPRFTLPGGEVYCPSEIHRGVRVVSGAPRVRVEFCPAPNYASAPGSIVRHEEYFKVSSNQGPYNSFYLYTDFDPEALLSGEAVPLKESAFFLLSYHEKMDRVDQEKVYVEYEKTKSYWLDWVSRTQLPQDYKELVIRSAITLKMLMFQRTGAVIAAPTTSLPEIVGGARNWDYRYCWVRDASMIIDLCSRIGHAHTSARFLSFILNRMLLKHENIGVMYGINGEEVLEEKTLDHLEGYRRSRPVRIGNGAYCQKQNDIYGELIAAIHTSFVADRGSVRVIDEEIWTVVRSLVNRVLEVWAKPDAGIWERRDKERHYVHSKMMAWVALDRAARIASVIGKTGHLPRLMSAAEQVRRDILENGWDPKQKSFVMFYGGKELDAANLLMLHYGFLTPEDEKMRLTILRTWEGLSKNGLLLRYSGEDGFGAPANSFLVCNFWMVNALHAIGQTQEARTLFERVIGHANAFGLLSEDLDPVTGELTGNFPQGYSHLALIKSAFILEGNNGGAAS